MTRYFKPVGGFFEGRNPPKKTIAIELKDDGHTTRIFDDGSRVDEGTVGKGHVFIPGWSKQELENLIAAKKWEDITEDFENKAKEKAEKAKQEIAKSPSPDELAS